MSAENKTADSGHEKQMFPSNSTGDLYEFREGEEWLDVHTRLSGDIQKAQDELNQAHAALNEFLFDYAHPEDMDDGEEILKRVKGERA